MSHHPARIGVVALLLACAGAGHAQEATDQLECGETISGRLAAGEARTFTFFALPGEMMAIEAVDISGENGLLQIRVEGPGLRLSTCTGRIEPARELARAAALDGGLYTLRVSACFGEAPVEFAITLNLLSDSRRTCGALLRCRGTVSAELSQPGEVDAFRFRARRGDLVDLRLTNDIANRGGLEVRVFDPDGYPVERGPAARCMPAQRVRTEKAGVYTVLVNSCLGLGTGTYRVNWASDECPPIALRGVHSGAEAVEFMVSADGNRVERIAADGASCGFATVPAFTLPVDRPIASGRFSVSGEPVVERQPGRRIGLAVDGVFRDADGDGRIDQGLGGFAITSDEGRCNFQWVATALPDQDGDGWSDRIEVDLGSDPRDSASTPEDAAVPTTRLFGPGVCRDYEDNDGNQTVDRADARCAPDSELPADPQPRLYAGRQAGGSGFWLERSADAATVASIATVALPCATTLAEPLRVQLGEPIDATGRFDSNALDIPAATGVASVRVYGRFIDADGDGIDEQGVGRVRVDTGSGACTSRWWVTGHVDADGDGWSDAAERRLGSDPRPFPAGLGGNSVPENEVVSQAADVLGVDVCSDGIDNDGDGHVDFGDAPDCPAVSMVTPTPPAPTPTPRADVCAGDCNEDGDITVDEVLLLVAASLGTNAASCAAGDVDANGVITVDEIVTAITHALAGCA